MPDTRCGFDLTDFTYRSAAVAALILFSACAKQAPPPGGPPDKTSPRVVWTVPAADSVGVSRHTSIRIGFSEAMDRRSVERVLFVSPKGASEPDFKWRDRELEISLGEQLRSDRTYVVTVGSESSDEWRNRMATSYSFAFATGESLNWGEIVSRVYDPEGPLKGEVYVWAYDVEAAADPHPVRETPAYVTQPSTDGEFRFLRLGPGRYRIFAFEDSDRDRSYTPGTDRLAVPPADVALPPEGDRIRLGPLRLALRDTIPPKFQSARTPDRRHVLLRFDEPVRPPPLVQIIGPGPLQIAAVYVDGEDASQVWLATGPQAKKASYRVVLEGFEDSSGNRIPAGVDAEVSGDGEPDGREPSLVSSFPPPDAGFIAPDAHLVMSFSDAMKLEIEFDFWIASDSTIVPDGVFYWPAPNRLQFSPSRPWPGGKAVRLMGRATQLSDLSGNHPTQMANFRFTVMDSAALGEISGRIDPVDARVVVQAWRLSGQAGVYETGVAPGDSSYTLAWLPPDTYAVSGFLDHDGDSEWTPGMVQPFVPAEPLSQTLDTLEVRARWATISEKRFSFIQTGSLEESRELLPGRTW